MNTVFIKILNMSIAASWLIAAVLLLRLLLRKAPRWISCVLWALVALRLIIPFTFESSLSAVPSSETISVGTSKESSPKSLEPIYPGHYPASHLCAFRSLRRRTGLCAGS